MFLLWQKLDDVYKLVKLRLNLQKRRQISKSGQGPKSKKGLEMKLQMEVLVLKEKLHILDPVSCTITEKQMKISEM